MSDGGGEPGNPALDADGADLRRRRRRRTFVLLGVAVLAACGIGAVLVLGSDDDDDTIVGTQESDEATSTSAGDTVSATVPSTQSATSASPTITTATTSENAVTSEATTPDEGTTGEGTTEEIATTVPSSAPSSESATSLPTMAVPTSTPSIDTSSAIWPRPGSALRFDDPASAADSFLREFVGFDEPVLGGFAAGDSRSGEIEARSNPDGPVTVVFVRQLDSDDWSVVGAASENISVSRPNALDVIESPLVISGSALAFEGTVDVLVYADDQSEPIVETFVTGSGGPEPGPFEGTLEWRPTSHRGGTLLFVSLSPSDGSAVEAVAVRVIFATAAD